MKKSHIFVLLVIILGIRASTEAQEIEYVNSILWAGIHDLQVVDNFAYCAFRNGLVVMDISDPQNPITVNRIYLPGESRGIFVDGNFAFIAGGSSGLFIVDIADPTHPIPLGTCDTPDDAQRVFVQGDYAYVSDVPQGLRIIDISDAGNPALIGNYITEGYIKGVFASGDYVYAAVGSHGLDIIDVSDPTNPILAANFDDTLYNATDVFIYDDYAYIAENSSDFRIVDVSDPPNPVYVGREWNHTRARDIVVADDYAYTANPEFGLEIYDVSDPHNIIHIAEYPMESPLLSYLHLEDNSVYLVDWGTGFHIIDVSARENPDYLGLYHQPRGSYAIEGGDGYAYVKFSTGFEVLDLADPENPAVISEFDFEEEIASIHLSGNTIIVMDPPYVTTFDVSDPASPEYGASYWEERGIREYFLDGSYIYMTFMSNSWGILDCSFPEFPYFIGYYDTPGIRMKIGVANGVAFVGAWTATELYDVSDPADIYWIGYSDLTLGVELFSHGNYLYSIGALGLTVIDVTDRENPEAVGYCEISGMQDLFFNDNYIIASLGASGINVIDISDPTDPVIVAEYNTPGTASDVYSDGQYIYVADGSSVVILRFVTTGIEGVSDNVPGDFYLSQNYPNPFNTSTTVYYQLPKESDVRLEIYDILGRKIETLVSGTEPGGAHSVVWNGQTAASGVYFYKLAVGDHVETRSCILLK